MKTLNNNKGLTLVEIVLAILILGMSATMLALTFSSAMRILNRATLYKNISASAAATVELEEKQEPIGGETFDVDIAQSDGTLTIVYTKNNVPDQKIEMIGQYTYGLAEKDDVNAHLRYKEFIPENAGTVPAEVPAQP